MSPDRALTVHTAPLAPRKPLLAPLLAAAQASLLAGCAIVPEDGKPQVQMTVEVADKYVHRGMPQNRNGVLQGEMDVMLPVKNGDTLTVSTFGNMDLKSSTGAAWFPGGHGGRFSEIDLTGTYAHAFENGIAVAGGLQTYIPPFGESFPQGPREQTTEMFVQAQKEFLGTTIEAQWRHDIDQANGSYFLIGVNEPFELNEELTLRLGSHIAWSSKSQSFWNYGLSASGLADLQGDAVLEYAFDDRTIIGCGLHASTMVDSGLRDWFDLIGIESENLWVGAFVTWTF